MDMLASVVWTNVLVTLFILVALALGPYLDKRYAPVGRYMLWIFVMMGFTLPFVAVVVPHTTLVPITISLPYGSSASELPTIHENSLLMEAPGAPQVRLNTDTPRDHGSYEPPPIVGSFPIAETPTLPSSAHAPQAPILRHNPVTEPSSDNYNPLWLRLSQTDIIRLITNTWLFGMMVFALFQATRHLRLVRYLKRWRIPTPDKIMEKTLQTEAASLGIKGNIPLVFVKGIAAPMLTGLFRPTIYLPDEEFTPLELSLILRHELIHYKRKDLWYKLALVAIRCLYWYNPAAHLMAQQANKDMETLCDNQTLRNMDINLRKSYGNLILRMVAEPVHAPVTTYITGGKHMLKQRLSNILYPDGKKGGRLIAVAGLVLLTIGLITGVGIYAAHEGLDYTNYDNSVLLGEPEENLFHSVVEEFINMESHLEAIRSESWDRAINDSNEWIQTMHTVAERRTASGLLPYSDCYDELRALVFDEPRQSEIVLSNEIITLELNTAYENIHIVSGGERLTIRYYEWLEGQYELREENGHIIIETSIPFFHGPLSGTNRRFLNLHVRDGVATHNSWLVEYLHERKGTPATSSFDASAFFSNPILITIPEGMSPNITINSSFGSTTIEGASISKVTINAQHGDLYLIDSVITSGIINAPFGNFTMRGTSFTHLALDTSFGRSTIYLPEDVAGYDIILDTGSQTLTTLGGVRATRAELRNPDARIRLYITAGFGNVDLLCPNGTQGSGEADSDFPTAGHVFGWNEAFTSNRKNRGVIDSNRPMLGIAGMFHDEAQRGIRRLPSVGLLVVDLLRNDWQEGEGLMPDDLIIAIDNTELTTSNSLARFLRHAEPGQQVNLLLYRNEVRITVTITLIDFYDTILR